MTATTAELLDVLGRLGAGEGDLWGWLVGLAPRRRMVQQALDEVLAAADWDALEALEAALAPPPVRRAVAAWGELSHGDAAPAGRLIDHARGLGATTGVALALRLEEPGAGLRWAQAAGAVLHPQAAVPSVWPAAGPVAGRVGRLLPPRELPLAWYWVQCHRAGPATPAVGPWVSRPVAAWQPVGGALIYDLLLQRLPAASGLLVHPELALMPLADELTATLEEARQSIAGGLAWSLAPRGGAETERLAGTSLGAAAAVGCRALAGRWRPDPHCLLVAQVLADRLEPVEHEAAKLDAASAVGIERAVLAADSRVLTDAAAEGRRPLVLHGAATVREAARWSRRRAVQRRSRWLLTATLLFLAGWWQGWAGLPADFRLRSSYRLV
ncbi:MAG: hypothetical protein IT204_05000, partial [Fimbriimonadaceae bacterium]|nr:hypothetical protein [Fimbriimonadaceae bacterium]